MDHMLWIAKAIDEYKPDTVVHLGDHWDFPSVSRHTDPGTLEKEGQRLAKDIEAGNKAMSLLTSFNHVPKNMILLEGNHENRMNRYIAANPVLEGVLGDHLLNLEGWKYVKHEGSSPGQIVIDDICYAHYFANPNTGKPISGTIQNRLSKIGQSFIQGHQQGLLQGNVQYATGRIVHGIMAGSCYLHDEEYKGQSNHHWRGIVVLNEVRKGEFCEMPLTLDYLCRKYEGVSLKRFLNKKYKNARERFSLARKED